MGNFYRAARSGGPRATIVGFAAGSGITPLLSIIKTTLAAEPHSRFTLFYGNRASSSIMFREELEDLKNEHLDRFGLIHILSREQQDIDLFNGRIDKAKCDAAARRTGSTSRSIDAAFICGPQDMMLQVAESLQEHGLDQRQIKFELFATAEAGRRAAQAARRGGGRAPNLCRGDGRSSTAARASLSSRRARHQHARRGAAGGHGAALSPARPASARPAGPCWSRARSTWTPTTRSRTTRSRAATS